MSQILGLREWGSSATKIRDEDSRKRFKVWRTGLSTGEKMCWRLVDGCDQKLPAQIFARTFGGVGELETTLRFRFVCPIFYSNENRSLLGRLRIG